MKAQDLKNKTKVDLANLYYNQMVTLGQVQTDKVDMFISACMKMTKSFLVESLVENSK